MRSASGNTDTLRQFLAQIEQVGDSRILWRRQEFATLLKVVEDSRDAEQLTTSFELIQSVRWPFPYQ